MTEEEWLKSDNPDAMLETLDLPSHRKLRLFTCACCRQIWHFLTDNGKQAIEVGERYADGTATREEFLAARKPGYGLYSDATAAVNCAIELYQEPLDPRHTWKWAAAASTDAPAAWKIQSQILRCLFCPFRPVAFAPEWRTDTAVTLARTMYASREFSAMPILADALQDAGCDNTDILSHCRSEGTHVRGCWVIDLVLGKE